MKLKQLSTSDLTMIEGLCQPFDAEGSVTLQREIAISMLNEIKYQREQDFKRRNAGGGTVWIESLVSMRTGEPLVKLHYGNTEAQLTAPEAIAHAGRIMEVAAGAYADAFLSSFLKEKLNVDHGPMGQILREFREHRERLDAEIKQREGGQ